VKNILNANKKREKTEYKKIMELYIKFKDIKILPIDFYNEIFEIISKKMTIKNKKQKKIICNLANSWRGCPYNCYKKINFRISEICKILENEVSNK